MDSTTSATTAISVVIVDDDPGMRHILASSLARSSELACIEQFSRGEDALKQAPALRPNVILMDVTLGRLDGIECVRRISEMLPETRIIMLTVHENPDVIFASFAAGAVGYLLKPPNLRHLLDAVREVHGGGGFINSAVARKVIESFRKPASVVGEMSNLTPRELEVLHLLAKGLAVKEIAIAHKLSFHTIREYTERIYRKLHVRSRARVVAKLRGEECPPPSTMSSRRSSSPNLKTPHHGAPC